MTNTKSNLTPITIEEFINRVENKEHSNNKYFSLYVTPSGYILDCRYPYDLGHNDFCIDVYKYLDELPKKIYASNLRTLNIPFDDISYYLMDYFKLLDVMYADPDLYVKIQKFLLCSEDKICQDMGFIKIAINTQLKSFDVVIPNALFERHVTGAQKDVINQLSTLFNVDLDERLKQEQKNNIKITTEVNYALTKVKNSTP